MQAIASYLQPGRLADVLALIQVLAYDYETYRSEEGIRKELQRAPTHGNSWMSVGQEHPEFFRVRNEPGKTPRLALLSRYVLPHKPTVEGDEKRPALEVAVANKLMELAIQLHDKQLERTTRWKSVVLPMVVALVAATASITSAIIGLAKATPATALQTPPTTAAASQALPPSSPASRR